MANQLVLEKLATTGSYKQSDQSNSNYNKLALDELAITGSYKQSDQSNSNYNKLALDGLYVTAVYRKRLTDFWKGNALGPRAFLGIPPRRFREKASFGPPTIVPSGTFIPSFFWAVT